MENACLKVENCWKSRTFLNNFRWQFFLSIFEHFSGIFTETKVIFHCLFCGITGYNFVVCLLEFSKINQELSELSRLSENKGQFAQEYINLRNKLSEISYETLSIINYSNFANFRWLIAYNSDSLLVSTAVSPHYTTGFCSSMLFSLDHCVWFHRSEVKADEWLLFECKSRIASGSRATIEGRIWRRDGVLIASCQQEALVRSKSDEPSKL